MLDHTFPGFVAVTVLAATGYTYRTMNGLCKGFGLMIDLLL